MNTSFRTMLMKIHITLHVTSREIDGHRMRSPRVITSSLRLYVGQRHIFHTIEPSFLSDGLSVKLYFPFNIEYGFWTCYSVSGGGASQRSSSVPPKRPGCELHLLACSPPCRRQAGKSGSLFFRITTTRLLTLTRTRTWWAQPQRTATTKPRR